ncbi:MAG: hypothetical protein GXY01_09155 [Clostridiales bacterium]|nr:hypothetical protein [Clostridiales bacterium]
MSEHSRLRGCKRYTKPTTTKDDERPGAIMNWLGTSPPEQTDNFGCNSNKEEI